MILIISNIANEAAPRLVDMFPPGTALLITASSFHQVFRGGFNTDNFSAAYININGKTIPATEITGVITTISSFIPQEFYYIQPADQKYVCAEMNAFFTWFLSALDCKKVNPPSVRSFCGGSILKIEWIKRVSASDVPIWPVTIINSKNIIQNDVPQPDCITCSIVGDNIIGTKIPEQLRQYLFKLQAIFAVPFLTASFILGDDGRYYLVEMTTKPNIDSEANRRAIVDYFLQP